MLGPDAEAGADAAGRGVGLTESRALDEIKIGGMGASRRRVEDNRFIRGRGHYIDDVVLPRMLHMEILRSPLAHASIRSIDVSKAYEDPGRPAGAHRRDDGAPATSPGCRRSQ